MGVVALATVSKSATFVSYLIRVRTMDRVVSGIRPTGHLHIGNYYGAMRSFLEMQDQYDCYFFIADWHSLTTHPRPSDIVQDTDTVLAEYLACGLDPNKVVLYRQSDVPEVLELYLYLNMNAYLGELQRTTTFKEKARKQPNNVNAGLLTYPTLMAADILLQRATKVPVGKDQEQNMEMARRFARRFNTIYGVEYFTEPISWAFMSKPIKVPGLDGSGKMGKSEGNAIYLYEDEKSMTKKVMRAVTDAGPTVPNSKPSDPVENLFTILDLVSTPETIAYFRHSYADCSIRYGDLKKQLATDLVAATAPIRERIRELSNDKKYLHEVAEYGAIKARESARKTIEEVRQIIGFAPIAR